MFQPDAAASTSPGEAAEFCALLLPVVQQPMSCVTLTLSLAQGYLASGLYVQLPWLQSWSHSWPQCYRGPRRTQAPDIPRPHSYPNHRAILAPEVSLHRPMSFPGPKDTLAPRQPRPQRCFAPEISWSQSYLGRRATRAPELPWPTEQPLPQSYPCHRATQATQLLLP